MQNVSLPELRFLRQTVTGGVNDLECSPEAQLMVLEAEALGIAWEIVPFSTVVKYSYKGHEEYVRNGVSSMNKIPGPQICYDKYLTRVQLGFAGIPLPPGFSITNADKPAYWSTVFAALQKPLVVKPAFGTHGSGVKVGITDELSMFEHVTHLLNTSEKDTELRSGMVLVEEQLHGKEYRIVATCDKLLAVMHRQPASVVGDGSMTVKELIHKKNQLPVRNISQALYPHIVIDADMLQVLADQNLATDSVPGVDQVVWLRTVSNIMAGGDAIDVTDQVHPSVSELAIRICRAIPGMTLVGIDFMTEDIAVEQSTVAHGVIEVNSAPEYVMHDLPMTGKKRGVAKEILLILFPELRR